MVQGLYKNNAKNLPAAPKKRKKRKKRYGRRIEITITPSTHENSKKRKEIKRQVLVTDARVRKDKDH